MQPLGARATCPLACVSARDRVKLARSGWELTAVSISLQWSASRSRGRGFYSRPFELSCNDSGKLVHLSPNSIITLRVKLSGAVYCNRSCLCVCVFVGVLVCLWVCYHDNSKLRASILTKLGL